MYQYGPFPSNTTYGSMPETAASGGVNFSQPTAEEPPPPNNGCNFHYHHQIFPVDQTTAGSGRNNCHEIFQSESFVVEGNEMSRLGGFSRRRPSPWRSGWRPPSGTWENARKIATFSSSCGPHRRKRQLTAVASCTLSPSGTLGGGRELTQLPERGVSAVERRRPGIAGATGIRFSLNFSALHLVHDLKSINWYILYNGGFRWCSENKG